MPPKFRRQSLHCQLHHPAYCSQSLPGRRFARAGTTSHHSSAHQTWRRPNRRCFHATALQFPQCCEQTQDAHNSGFPHTAYCLPAQSCCRCPFLPPHTCSPCNSSPDKHCWSQAQTALWNIRQTVPQHSRDSKSNSSLRIQFADSSAHATSCLHMSPEPPRPESSDRLHCFRSQTIQQTNREEQDFRRSTDTSWPEYSKKR